MTPNFEAIVCPWSCENPRHDHQLLFALDAQRLMLVWCEYYADRPAHLARSGPEAEGGFGDEAPCRISARISVDGGRHFAERFILQCNQWTLNVKHPNLVRLPDGELVFTFTGWESAEQRPVYLRRSADNAETWSDPQCVSGPGWYCTNHDRILTLSSGRILLPAHGVLGGGPYVPGSSKLCSWVWYSDDGFQTWQKSAEMTAPGRGAHEPTIVELKDGRLLCHLRTTNGRVFRSVSEDQGQSWATPVATKLPAPDSESLLARIPGTGDLLCLWNNVESYSNWPRTPLTAAVSRDEGTTWENWRNIDDRAGHDAAYPSVYFREDEAIVMYYSRNNDTWARDSEITQKIFPVSEFYA